MHSVFECENFTVSIFFCQFAGLIEQEIISAHSSRGVIASLEVNKRFLKRNVFCNLIRLNAMAWSFLGNIAALMEGED
jgi:hypothetical protein